MKKLISVILIVLVLVSFTGCGKQGDTSKDTAADQPVSSGAAEPEDRSVSTPDASQDAGADESQQD